jgi:haloalkane dehalogenase
LWLIRNLPLLPTLLVRGFNAFSVGATYLATAKGLPTDVKAAYRAPYSSWNSRIATLRFVQDIPVKPGDRSYALAKWVDDHLERLREVPVLIGWGERDFVFDRDFLAEWRRRLPDAEVHSFADAGHYVLEDAPEKLIPRIRDFIEREARPARQSTAAGVAS